MPKWSLLRVSKLCRLQLRLRLRLQLKLQPQQLAQLQSLIPIYNGCSSTYSTFAFASAPPWHSVQLFSHGKNPLGASPIFTYHSWLHKWVGECACGALSMWVCASVCADSMTDGRTCVHVSAKWMRRVELNHRSLLPNPRMKYSLRSKSEATKNRKWARQLVWKTSARVRCNNNPYKSIETSQKSRRIKLYTVFPSTRL